MVIPFSRSRYIESMRRSSWDSCWLARKVPDCLSKQSTSVVLPWSTCAIIAIFLICCIFLKPNRVMCLVGRGKQAFPEAFRRRGAFYEFLRIRLGGRSSSLKIGHREFVIGHLRPAGPEV